MERIECNFYNPDIKGKLPLIIHYSSFNVRDFAHTETEQQKEEILGFFSSKFHQTKKYRNSIFYKPISKIWEYGT